MEKEHLPEIQIKTVYDVSDEEKATVAGEIDSSVRPENFDDLFDQLVVSSIEIPSTGELPNDEPVRD